MNPYFTLEDIENRSNKLPAAESKNLKNKLINKFCRTSTNYCKEYRKGVNGYFLWSCTQIQPTVITIYHIKHDPPFHGKVLVCWDHNVEKDPLWRAGREFIYELDFEVITDHLNKFPQDIYIFNRNFSRLLVRSHECIAEDRNALLLY